MRTSWRPSVEFQRNQQLFERNGKLDGDSVSSLAALAATEISKSDRPEALKAHYASYFRALPAPSGRLTFEALAGAGLSTAERRLGDPALAMVRTRDVAQFNAPADSVSRAVWALVNPEQVEVLGGGDEALLREAKLRLAIPEAQRAEARALIGDTANQLTLWNPERTGDTVTFTSELDGTGVKLTLQSEAEVWKLTSIERSTKVPLNGQVKTTLGEGFFSRFEPPTLAHVYDEKGVRTDRQISEITRLTMMGDRAVSGAPDDLRPVTRAEVIFDDGSKAALFQIGVPYWSAGGSGAHFSLGGDDYSTVQPITEPKLYS